MTSEIVNDALKAMRRIAKNTDSERAHGHADALLCTTIMDLARRYCWREDREALIKMVKLFKGMKKWYA